MLIASDYLLLMHLTLIFQAPTLNHLPTTLTPPPTTDMVHSHSDTSFIDHSVCIHITCQSDLHT